MSAVRIVPISGVLLHNLHVIDPGEQAIKVNPARGRGRWTTEHTGMLAHRAHRRRTSARQEQLLYRRARRPRGDRLAHPAQPYRGLLVRCRPVGARHPHVAMRRPTRWWRKISSLTAPEGSDSVSEPVTSVTTGGIIRNNFVAAGGFGSLRLRMGFDSGISLWGADDAEVYHNTVASTQQPRASSIEWRIIATWVALANNLTTGVDSGPWRYGSY